MDPKCAAAPLVIGKAGFEDIEEQAAQLRGYDQIYRQLSRGRFRGEFSTVAVGDAVGIFLETSNQIIEQGAVVPKDQCALIFMAGGEHPARFGNRPFDRHQYMFLPPGREIDFRNALDTSICVVTVSFDEVEQRLEAGFGRSSLGETLTFDHPNVLMWLTATTLDLMSHAFAWKVDSARDALAAALSSDVVDLVAAALRYGGAQTSSGHDRHADTRSDLFRRARDRIHTRLDRVTIGDLQRHLHVSRRTLEYAFGTSAGTSPRSYIAMTRLNAVRRDMLRTADTIGDLAARYGIWHLGRFSAAYCAAFGELPSATRRRTR